MEERGSRLLDAMMRLYRCEDVEESLSVLEDHGYECVETGEGFLCRYDFEGGGSYYVVFPCKRKVPFFG